MTKITIDRAVVGQALVALEAACGGRCNAEYNPCWQRQMADAFRAALAEPVQEPVQEPYCHVSFNNWWDGDIDTTDNPFRQDSPAFWAWEGWKACAKVCESLFDADDDTCDEAEKCAAAIRARGQ